MFSIEEVAEELAVLNGRDIDPLLFSDTSEYFLLMAYGMVEEKGGSYVEPVCFNLRESEDADSFEG